MTADETEPQAKGWPCPECGRVFSKRNQQHVCGSWTVEQHVEKGPEWVVPLFRLFCERLEAIGEFDYAPVRAQVGFRGPRRIFAAVRLTEKGLGGYLDLPRRVESDLFTSVSPYTKQLLVYHFTFTSEDQFTEELDGYLREAHGVGRGSHLA